MNASPPEDCYVVLHIGTGPSASAEARSGPSIIATDGSGRFELSADVWIERLDEQLAKNIQRACEPPHYKIDTTAPDRHLYALVRRVSQAEKIKYESLAELHAVIALSRLINPTSTGDRYFARVFDLRAADSPIQAIQYRGSPDVFLGSNSRDWLSVEDGKILQKLIPWSSKDRLMYERVYRAYWNHENAMRSYYLDIRWTLVVSGLEALVNTREQGVRRQFKDRVRQLADEFKIDLSNGELYDAYTLRSKLVHAQSFLFDLEKVVPKDRHNELYEKLELLLRETIKRCLLDEKFGSFFRDADAVETRWGDTSVLQATKVQPIQRIVEQTSDGPPKTPYAILAFLVAVIPAYSWLFKVWDESDFPETFTNPLYWLVLGVLFLLAGAWAAVSNSSLLAKLRAHPSNPGGHGRLDLVIVGGAFLSHSGHTDILGPRQSRCKTFRKPVYGVFIHIHGRQFRDTKCRD